MSSSKSSLEDLGDGIESWVDIQTSSGGGTPGSVTPQLSAEDYLRLLREAQRESNQSSARVSLAGSRRDSPRSSPKSPPNSPVQGSTPLMEWQAYYVNNDGRDDVENGDSGDNVEVLSEWSSRPDQLPPKNWSFRHPKRDVLTLRYARVGDSSVFSRKGLCTLFLTNLISLLIGTGMGLLLSKFGICVPAIRLR